MPAESRLVRTLIHRLNGTKGTPATPRPDPENVFREFGETIERRAGSRPIRSAPPTGSRNAAGKGGRR